MQVGLGCCRGSQSFLEELASVEKGVIVGNHDSDRVQAISPQEPTVVAPEFPAVSEETASDLEYTSNEDGTRNYAGQKPVKTVDTPTK